MLPVATEVNRLLLRDKYLRMLAAEISILFPMLAATFHIFTENPYMATLSLLPALAAIPAWLRWEARRKRRTMKIFEVTNVRDLDAPTSCCHVGLHLPSVNVRLTVVDAVHESTVVRYVDYERRQKGENVVLILDERCRVLAASSLSRPPRLEAILGLG